MNNVHTFFTSVWSLHHILVLIPTISGLQFYFSHSNTGEHLTSHFNLLPCTVFCCCCFAVLEFCYHCFSFVCLRMSQTSSISRLCFQTLLQETCLSGLQKSCQLFVDQQPPSVYSIRAEARARAQPLYCEYSRSDQIHMRLSRSFAFLCCGAGLCAVPLLLSPSRTSASFQLTALN